VVRIYHLKQLVFPFWDFARYAVHDSAVRNCQILVFLSYRLQPIPEIGVLEIELTEEGIKDSLFKGIPAKQRCLQWHSVRVTQTPEDAIVLAKSDVCSVQAMRVGNNAWSMQYHVEIESDTVDNWGSIPAYASALQSTLGDNGLETMKTESSAIIDNCMVVAKQIYDNFMLSIEK